MVTKYPAAIDTVFTLKPLVDGQPVTGGSVEQLRVAIIAIEEELGVKPSAVYTTVRARLDTIESIVGNLRVIEIEGDLGGTLETPRVIGIQGRPVSDVEPIPGEVLVWDGIAWVPAPGPSAVITFGGDLAGNPAIQIVIGIQGNPVNSSFPNTNDVLLWDGSNWSPTAITFSGDVNGDLTNQTVVALQGVPVISDFPNVNDVLTFDGSEWFPAPSSGGGGATQTLTYQPGGSDDPASGVYTSWTDLMDARANISSVVTVILDDTGSESGVTIDNGDWDLTANTKIVGFSRTNPRVKIIFGDGGDNCSFSNPFEFENVVITGPVSEATSTININGLPSPFQLNFRNCAFADNAYAITLFPSGTEATFNLYGNCDFAPPNPFFWVANGSTLTLNLYDSSVVGSNLVFANTNAGSTLNVNTYSTGASFANQENWSPQTSTQNVGPPVSTFNSPEVAFTGGYDVDKNFLPATSSLRNSIKTFDSELHAINSVEPTTDNQMIRIVSEVSAIQEGGTDVAWFLLKGVWWFDGSTLNEVRPPSVVDHAIFGDSSTWTAQLVDNGAGAIETQVSAEEGKTVHWSVVREWIESV